MTSNEINLKRNKHLLNPSLYRNVFSPEECLKIINCPDASEKQSIYTELGKYDPSVKDIRARYLRKTPDTLWVWDRVFNYVWKINQDYYNFNISFLTDMHILQYSESSWFDWHIDITQNEAFSTRKISVVVFLSDRTDYVGGQLLLSLNDNPISPMADMEQGSLVAFPSYQIHKVEPVTSGERYTLVAWAHGDSFR
jgi:PKHD-type hydroxylase